MSTWQLQHAKSNFSALMRACISKGPQIISIRGKEEAVIISKEEYCILIGKKTNFVDFINASPLKGIKLNLSRDKSLSRDIKL